LAALTPYTEVYVKFDVIFVCRFKATSRNLYYVGCYHPIGYKGKARNMREFLKRWRNFSQSQEGVTAIEYALIAAATGLALAATVPTVGANLEALGISFNNYFNP
jgi:Flp pilus assembly pilin Flp